MVENSQDHEKCGGNLNSVSTIDSSSLRTLINLCLAGVATGLSRRLVASLSRLLVASLSRLLVTSLSRLLVASLRTREAGLINLTIAGVGLINLAVAGLSSLVIGIVNGCCPLFS